MNSLPAARVSPFALAVVFGRISSTAFGGGQMSAIRREVVRRNRWLDEDEYLELLALAQVTPGANPTNLAVLVGGRLAGALGAAAALLGSVLPGFILLMLLAALTLREHIPALSGALRGCAAAAVGSMLANAIEMTLPRRGRLLDLALIAAVGAAVVVLHASLLVTLLAFVPLALLLQRALRA